MQVVIQSIPNRGPTGIEEVDMNSYNSYNISLKMGKGYTNLAHVNGYNKEDGILDKQMVREQAEDTAKKIAASLSTAWVWEEKPFFKVSLTSIIQANSQDEAVKIFKKLEPKVTVI